MIVHDIKELVICLEDTDMVNVRFNDYSTFVIKCLKEKYNEEIKILKFEDLGWNKFRVKFYLV